MSRDNDEINFVFWVNWVVSFYVGHIRIVKVQTNLVAVIYCFFLIRIVPMDNDVINEPKILRIVEETYFSFGIDERVCF